MCCSEFLLKSLHTQTKNNGASSHQDSDGSSTAKEQHKHRSSNLSVTHNRVWQLGLSCLYTSAAMGWSKREGFDKLLKQSRRKGLTWWAWSQRSHVESDARKLLLYSRRLKVRDTNVLWEMWDFLFCQSDVSQKILEALGWWSQKERLRVCNGPVKCFTERGKNAEKRKRSNKITLYLLFEHYIDWEPENDSYNILITEAFTPTMMIMLINKKSSLTHLYPGYLCFKTFFTACT